MLKKIKKIIPFLIVASLFLGLNVPNIASAKTTTAKASTTKKTVVKKTSTKKTAAKKKAKPVAKKEHLIINPQLFTYDNAPHSAKPVAKTKKKTPKKIIAKKRA